MLSTAGDEKNEWVKAFRIHLGPLLSGRGHPPHTASRQGHRPVVSAKGHVRAHPHTSPHTLMHAWEVVAVGVQALIRYVDMLPEWVVLEDGSVLLSVAQGPQTGFRGL